MVNKANSYKYKGKIVVSHFRHKTNICSTATLTITEGGGWKCKLKNVIPRFDTLISIASAKSLKEQNTSKTTHRKPVCDKPQRIVSWALHSQVIKTTPNPVSLTDTTGSTFSNIDNWEVTTTHKFLTTMEITLFFLMIKKTWPL